MQGRITDAAPIEIPLQRKHDAMGKSIETFRRDDAGLLEISERVTQTHQPGAQASAGRITDAQLLDQLRPMQPALLEVSQRFWMPVQPDLVELGHVVEQRAHAIPVAQ